MRWTALMSTSLLVAAGLVVAGCADTANSARQALGLGKNAPDEFRVVQRAPLAMPPDFSLRPPAPGSQRPQEATSRDSARRAVFRADDGETREVAGLSESLSQGERALLSRAGVANADPDIRLTIDREASLRNTEDQGFLDSLVFWDRQGDDGVLLDAAGESRRLQENTATGRAASEGGDSPVIERRSRGILDNLF